MRLRKAVRLLSACSEKQDRAQLTAPSPKEQQTEGFHSKNPHPVFFQGSQTPVQQQAPSGLLWQAEGWEKAVPAWTPEVWSPVKVVDGDTPPGHGDTPPAASSPAGSHLHPHAAGLWRTACGFLCLENKLRAPLMVLSGTNYFLALLLFMSP